VPSVYLTGERVDPDRGLDALQMAWIEEVLRSLRPERTL
jgi:hypothetical protein